MKSSNRHLQVFVVIDVLWFYISYGFHYILESKVAVWVIKNTQGACFVSIMGGGFRVTMPWCLVVRCPLGPS